MHIVLDLLLFEAFFSDQLSSPELYFTVHRHLVTGVIHRPTQLTKSLLSFLLASQLHWTAWPWPAFYKGIPSNQTLSKRFLVLHFGMESKMIIMHTEFSARQLFLCGCKVKYLPANITKTR